MLINHLKSGLTGRTIIGVETGPGRTLWNVTLKLDNGDWVFIEPMWHKRHNGAVVLLGLCAMTSVQIRDMRSNCQRASGSASK